jgi:Phage integrase family
LLFALSRFGGLRCPSEHLALKWTDFDWERSRFRVDSPKTGVRWVPIFPELRPFLEEAFDAAPEGAVHVINGYRDPKQNMRTRLERILRKAGVDAWPKLFHNLRASRETELTENHPIHVVCAWIGNSALIAQKHYLQVTEDHFALATTGPGKSGAKSGAVPVQNPVQQPAAPIRMESQEAAEGEESNDFMLAGAGVCEDVRSDLVPLVGLEPTTL